MEANKILSADILDIIFDGKNKDYGAYELRKTYNRRITRALVITGSVALLALLASVLSSTLSDKGDSKVKMNEMTIQDIKQEEKKEPPPTTTAHPRSAGGSNRGSPGSPRSGSNPSPASPSARE